MAAAKGRFAKSSRCRLLEGVAEPADDGDADGGDEEGGTANAWEFATSSLKSKGTSVKDGWIPTLTK